MPPAPTRIAAPPRPKSRASWNPAVPPPPVAGAAVRVGLADVLGDADGVGEGLAEVLAEGLALAVVALTVRLGTTVGVAETDAPGENVVGVAEGEDAVQAETDAEASMTNVPQPIAVNLALSPDPAMVARSFMEPPHVSVRWRTRFPVPVSETVRRRKMAWLARSLPGPAEGRWLKARAAIKVRPTRCMDGADMQWPVHHWNVRLRG